jgi:hypothetical protein
VPVPVEETPHPAFGHLQEKAVIVGVLVVSDPTLTEGKR